MRFYTFKEKGEKMRERSKLCSNCKKQKELETKRYCRSCHNAYMRKWRKTHPLNEEQRIKSIVRNKVAMRIRRGQMQRLPCVICGDPKSECHHEDYSKPYDIVFLCPKHHREHHNSINLSH